MARFYDTLLWEYIKNPWVRWISLDKLSTKEFNYMMISYDSITNKAKINFKKRKTLGIFLEFKQQLV